MHTLLDLTFIMEKKGNRVHLTSVDPHAQIHILINENEMVKGFGSIQINATTCRQLFVSGSNQLVFTVFSYNLLSSLSQANR